MQQDRTSHAQPNADRGPPRFERVPLFFLPVDKLKSSDRENSTEIHAREEGARRQEVEEESGERARNTERRHEHGLME